MRALAEFIMRGRMQAAIVALSGSILPLIGPVTVALVTLRRGNREGLLVLMWAVLPALVALLSGRVDAGLVLAGMAVIFFAALLLRATISWAYALMGLVGLSSTLSLLFFLLAPDVVAEMVKVFNATYEQMRKQMPAQQFSPVAFGPTLVVGLQAGVLFVDGLLGLMLARWLQSLLYNPGGFQTEFHQLRLNQWQAVTCLLATGYCLRQGVDYVLWACVFALPLILVGVTIVHYLIKRKNIAAYWLALFYAALVLFMPLSAFVLMGVAVVDTWLNFRGRLTPKS